ALECARVGLRRTAEAADLAHVLHRCGANLLIGRAGIVVVQGADVSTHAPIVARVIACDGRRSCERELATRNDHSRAAHLHPLDVLGRALRAREQDRWATDLRALADLDPLSERDPTVAAEMNRERPC